TQVGLEVHPAPGNVGVQVLTDPGRVDAGRVEVDAVATDRAVQVLDAVGAADHHAPADAVAGVEVEANLATVVVLLEAVRAAGAEGLGVGDVDRTAVTPDTDPRAEPVQPVLVRHHTHALTPGADVA